LVMFLRVWLYGSVRKLLIYYWMLFTLHFWLHL
jgi:hypothetical protein